MNTTAKPCPLSTCEGRTIERHRLEARARNYQASIEKRQSALCEESLIAFSPYRIVRLARVQCYEHGEWKITGYATRNSLRHKLGNSECKRPHSIELRVWGVCGRAESVVIEPMILEWFNDILMARVLRDDMNLKAATAIMARER